MAWLYQSRKAQVALGAILTIVLSRLLPRLGFTTEDVNAIGMAIGAIASVWIGGIAHEDASSKQAPQNQTNVNSDVTNAPPAAPVAKPDPFTPDQLDFIYSQIRQRAQRAKPVPPPAPPAPAVEIHRI